MTTTVLLLTTPLAMAQSEEAADDMTLAITSSGQGLSRSTALQAGTMVRGQWTDTPPVLTMEQQRALEEGMASSTRPGPLGPTAVVPAGQPTGPAVPAPDMITMRRPGIFDPREQGATSVTQHERLTGVEPSAPLGAIAANPPNTFTYFRSTGIPSSGIAGGYSRVSSTQEPSTVENGKVVFQTGNWYATRSYNTGVTWQFLDPFTLFGSGFCCDQVTVYDQSRNHVFWLLQYSDRIVLANSVGTDLTNWCFYSLTPALFGLPANTVLDYNDLALGKNFIYWTTNLFTGASGALIVRFSLDAMAACGGLSYSFVTRADTFTFKPVQGAQDVMYWGSNWITGKPFGTSFRAFSWAENSATYFFYDRVIDAFAFMTRNSGQNCGSVSGAVANWCQFSDSRVLGGYRANGVIGFSFNAKQDVSHPFPYSRRVSFRESDIAYLGKSELWATWVALLFLSLAPDQRGNIGGVFYWGGGTGTTNHYPGTGILIQDDYSPNQPWGVSFGYSGAFNTCTSQGFYRWGDYATIRPFYPSQDTWVASGYRILGNHCGSAGWYSQPINVHFGRERDRGSVTRWWVQ
ncbi:MAG: hypothetical protein HY267_08915 [Deltaproteobacteria bacterium]|nr:hypothetical protein [Deltaproteobacteria bacterium]